MKQTKLDFFFKYRWWVAVSLIAITLLFIPYAISLKPDNSIESLGVVDDPGIPLIHRLEQDFGGDEFVSIAFAPSDLFSAANLQMIEHLTQDLEKIPNIVSVISLTRLPKLSKTKMKDGGTALGMGKLIDPSWLNTGVSPQDKKTVLASQIFNRLIYNDAGSATALIAQFGYLGANDAARDAIIKNIQEVLNQEAYRDTNFHMAGMPVIHRFALGMAEKEQNLTTGILVALIALIFFLLYRRLSLVMIPIGLIVIIMLWMLGLIGLSGTPYSWMLAIGPGVVLILSVCNMVHIINTYFHSTKTSKNEKYKDVIFTAGFPCFMASLTDLVGFFSISGSQIQALRSFGIFVAIGSLVALVMSLVFIPLFLNALDFTGLKKGEGWLETRIKVMLEKIYALNIRYPRRVLMVAGVVSLLLMAGISRVVVEQHFVTMYKWGGEKIKADNDFVTQNVGGGAHLYVDFAKQPAGTFEEPRVLKIMEKIQKRLEAETHGAVLKTASVADLVKFANQSFHDDDPQFHVVPQTKAEAAQLLFAFSTEKDTLTLGSLVNDDSSEAVIRLFTVFSDSARDTIWSVDQVKKILSEEVPPDLPYTLAGRPLVMLNSLDNVIQTQVTSLVAGFGIMFLALWIVFRSLKASLLCLIPNVLPILIGLGIMGWAGIELDVATTMVAAMALGVVIDDSIHFVWGLRKGLQSGKDYEAVIKEIFDEVAPATISASLIVSVAFLGLCASQLWTTTYFGILTAATCVIALICELFISPALFTVFRPFVAQGQSVKKAYLA